jgi:G:T/U-mismatch repair DNA glycosylase
MLWKIMKDVIEEKVDEHLDEKDIEYEKGFGERVGKVIVVGVATVIVSMIVEASYDKFIERRRERDADVQA